MHIQHSANERIWAGLRPQHSHEPEQKKKIEKKVHLTELKVFVSTTKTLLFTFILFAIHLKFGISLERNHITYASKSTLKFLIFHSTHLFIQYNFLNKKIRNLCLVM